MGAAALVTDREVTSRLRAYINLESIGSSGTSILFETGPGNAWLVAPWARRAPHPRGGSYAIEVYRRLPNDTDFSILKTRDVPGLNFAAVGDSYAYHTARDTPERLAAYVRYFDPQFSGATGTLQAIAETTKRFGVPYAKVAAPGGGYTLDHGAGVFFVDPQATIRAYSSAPHDASVLATDYRALVSFRR